MKSAISFVGVERRINDLGGKPCTRREVGSWKSLSLGFGDEAPVTSIVPKRAYREWEIGSWRRTWRILHGNTVLLGSGDTDEIADLNLSLDGLELGHFSALRQTSNLDLRVDLDNGVSIDFCTTFSDDDEVFHVACPGQSWISFHAKLGWQIGPSNEPWVDMVT